MNTTSQRSMALAWRCPARIPSQRDSTTCTSPWGRSRARTCARRSPMSSSTSCMQTRTQTYPMHGTPVTICRFSRHLHCARVKMGVPVPAAVPDNCEYECGTSTYDEYESKTSIRMPGIAFLYIFSFLFFYFTGSRRCVLLTCAWTGAGSRSASCTGLKYRWRRSSGARNSV